MRAILWWTAHISSSSAINGFWSRGSTPLTRVRHRSIIAIYFFLPGLFLSVHFIIWDVFCLLVRPSSRLRATVGRQTNATSCQNFESVARRKGPAVFRVRSTWSRARRWNAVFFSRPPSDADECLLAELRARKRCRVLVGRHYSTLHRPRLKNTSRVSLRLWWWCIFKLLFFIQTVEKWYFTIMNSLKTHTTAFRPAAPAKNPLAR